MKNNNKVYQSYTFLLAVAFAMRALHIEEYGSDSDTIREGNIIYDSIRKGVKLDPNDKAVVDRFSMLCQDCCVLGEDYEKAKQIYFQPVNEKPKDERRKRIEKRDALIKRFHKLSEEVQSLGSDIFEADLEDEFHEEDTEGWSLEVIQWRLGVINKVLS